jgi:hypothetical protein
MAGQIVSSCLAAVLACPAMDARRLALLSPADTLLKVPTIAVEFCALTSVQVLVLQVLARPCVPANVHPALLLVVMSLH